MIIESQAGHVAPLDRADPRIAALVALALGAFLVIGTGFAATSALHNAAHDTRHSFAFPCH